MARRLAEGGHDVTAWNRTRERAEGLGAKVADAPAEAVRDAEVVVTMLADGPIVGETMREALPAMAAGTIWAQTSTIGIAAAEQLSAQADEHGVAFVDAPVLGSKVPAEQGQLVVLAAGPEPVRPRCEEVFAAISRATHWVGDGAPAGQALKLVINSWILNTVVNIGETVAFAEGLGLDPKLWLDAIAGGGMDMQYAHLKTEAIRSGNLAPTFKLALAHKDAGLVVDAAKGAGLDLALARTTQAQLAAAIALGHGAEDMAAVYFASRPKP
jgi:3-hydroxyisobutyrate dehydrogenase